MIRATLVLGALALAAWAWADELDATRITRLSRSDIVADPASLPASGYLSSGQPDRAVLEAIAEAGFAAVVDLRGRDEDRGIDERGAVESLGMTYVSLPIPSPAEATFENAAALNEILAGIDGPVLLHCRSGNRVGALFALSAKSQGASREDALALGKAAGLTRWEKAIREKLEIE